MGLAQIVGWAILLAIPAAHATSSQYSARYFACICIVTAGYTNIPLIICTLPFCETCTRHLQACSVAIW